MDLPDLEEVEKINIKDIPPLILRLTALQNALCVKLLETQNIPVPSPKPQDRFLTIQEASELLGVTQKWLYRNSKKLPFARRLSKKCLRFSENGLRKYQENKLRAV